MYDEDVSYIPKGTKIILSVDAIVQEYIIKQSFGFRLGPLQICKNIFFVQEDSQRKHEKYAKIEVMFR